MKIKNRQVEDFFQSIYNELDQNLSMKDVRLIIVTHIVADVLPFLTTLSRIANIHAIIPKRASTEKDTLTKIQELGLPIYNVGRSGVIKEIFLKKLFRAKSRFIIFDIGGYFASDTLALYAKNKLLGIVEDTENGQQKYNAILTSFSYPVISVARSPLKENEDELVGHSIGFYSEVAVRAHNLLPRYASVGIIGYGKVGRGIANYLLNQNLKPFVYDHDPVRMVKAYRDGCVPLAREDIISSSDLLFGATGNKSITLTDFPKLKDGCFLASATSPDDELGLLDTNALENYSITQTDAYAYKLTGRSNSFFLINKGNAANFILKGDRVGSMIRLVQGEQIAAALFIATNKLAGYKLYTTTNSARQSVARLFLEYFTDTHTIKA